MVTVARVALVWLLGNGCFYLRKAECRGKLKLELLWVDRGNVYSSRDTGIEDLSVAQPCGVYCCYFAAVIILFLNMRIIIYYNYHYHHHYYDCYVIIGTVNSRYKD